LGRECGKRPKWGGSSLRTVTERPVQTGGRKAWGQITFFVTEHKIYLYTIGEWKRERKSGSKGLKKGGGV